MRELPEFEAFAGCLGETFELATDQHAPLATQLVEAVQGKHAGPTRTPFSLLFRGPLEPVLPQQLFLVRHPRLGEFQMFLVPIGPDQAGMRYEAVVN